jgi:hemerythrin superfamily protein
MDAITLLKDDHKSVEKLFKDFEKAGDRAFVTKRKLVDRMIEALSRHAVIEELAFYPATRSTIPDLDAQALESVEEHHIVKWLLQELEQTDVEDERFDAKVTVLIENVRHHVSEEEEDYFPRVREEWGRNDLRDLGAAMVELKEKASPHPHPEAPHTPPANAVVAGPLAAVDRIADIASGLGQGGVDAVQDLIDRVRGVEPRRSGPTGSRKARRTASKVRQEAGGAVDRVVDSVNAARDVGEDATSIARNAAAEVGEAARADTKRAG